MWMNGMGCHTKITTGRIILMDGIIYVPACQYIIGTVVKRIKLYNELIANAI